MLKFFKIICLFFSLMLFVLFTFNAIFDLVLKKDKTNKFNWIMSKQNGTYDFSVIGSSRGACNIDIYTVESKTAQNGINLSMIGAAFAELRLLLESFLKTNSVKKLLIEVDIFGLDNSNFGHPYHEYNFFPYMKEEYIFSDIRSNSGVKAYIWKYLPFSKYAEFNSVSGMSGIISVLKNEPSLYDEKGGYMLDGVGDPYNKKNLDSIKINGNGISMERVAALRKMIELGKEKNSQVVLFISPEFFETSHNQSGRKKVIDLYSDLAKEYGILFYDFTGESMCRVPEYFADREHCTMNGAIEFSKIFSEKYVSLK